VARVSTVPFFVLTQLSSQIRTLKSFGADITVVASDDELSAKISELQGVAYMPINISRNISPVSDLVSLFRLYRAFRACRFDIIHSTTPKAGLLCSIAGFLSRVPVRVHTFTGQPWVTMTGIKRGILKCCDKVIGVLNTHCYADSYSQREFLVDQKIVRPKKLTVIGSGSLAGVDLARFSRSRYSLEHNDSLKRELNISGEARVILFVGRITQDKGIQELIDAFQVLALNDDTLHLILVGPFEENGKKVVGSVTGSVVSSRIHSVGFSDEPEKYMAISDVLCLPSYREGFGTVVIEAAAMGVPTVGTDIYGLSDAVVDGVTGILVPPRSSQALVNSLESMLSNDRARSCMADNAFARANTDFDSVKCATLLLNEYKRLLNEH
jgi:glycosyltransferase involved in cell wall biosynthesis